MTSGQVTVIQDFMRVFSSNKSIFQILNSLLNLCLYQTIVIILPVLPTYQIDFRKKSWNNELAEQLMPSKNQITDN